MDNTFARAQRKLPQKLITSKLRWEMSIGGLPIQAHFPARTLDAWTFAKKSPYLPIFRYSQQASCYYNTELLSAAVASLFNIQYPLVYRSHSVDVSPSFVFDTHLYPSVSLYEICLNLTCLILLISLILLVYCKARESTYTTPHYFCFGKYWTAGPSHIHI